MPEHPAFRKNHYRPRHRSLIAINRIPVYRHLLPGSENLVFFAWSDIIIINCQKCRRTPASGIYI